MIPHWITRRIWDALMHRVALTRPADFVIGGKDNPYMLRWWVIPRNKYFNIYLHHILRSDDDRALHDHSYWNLSFLLQGSYKEILPVVPNDPWWGTWSKIRATGDLVFRTAEASHRLELMNEGQASCWSLFVTGPRTREWGFACEKGWRPWKEFVDPTDPGKPGPGCD
jgi:hypothetical protein